MDELTNLKEKFDALAWKIADYVPGEMLGEIGAVFGAMASAGVPRELTAELVDLSYAMRDAVHRLKQSLEESN